MNFPLLQPNGIVSAATHALVNASLADDLVLGESLFQELVEVLDELRANWGDHPVLLETQADFHDEPTQRVELYRDALQLAEQHRLPTFTVRLSLARVLLDEFDDSRLAKIELIACQPDVVKNGDDGDRLEWAALKTLISQRESF